MLWSSRPSSDDIIAEQMPQEIERQSIADDQAEPLAPAFGPIAVAAVGLGCWAQDFFRLGFKPFQDRFRFGLRLALFALSHRLAVSSILAISSSDRPK